MTRMRSKKIAHLTSVHTRYDTRIFLKMCRSLALAGYQVTLVVADGKGDEERDGVSILDAGASRGRLDRMAGATRRVLRIASALDADIYHLHDPELMPAGLALTRAGKRVIFDAHEDLPGQLLSKSYIPAIVRPLVSGVMGVVERFACRRFARVVTATPAIRDKFRTYGIAAEDVNNFPMLGELETEIPWADKKRQVCYVGGIASTRGIRQVIDAMGRVAPETDLNLAGTFSELAVKAEVQALPGWDRVRELGFLTRSEVRDVLGCSVAGIVTFLPLPNHMQSQPNKMFEYMSAGIPVIASDFPLWREIIEGNACGICVDPHDPAAIARAIDRLVADPDLARRMGKNGREAVQARYNWTIEEQKLMALYGNVLGSS